MLETMRRLRPRSRASRGICVDAEGAMLGPDCILVRRTSTGYRCIPPEAARDIQNLALGMEDDPDWLFEQGQRIAKALDRDNIALAQIYGLRIPINELDAEQLKRLAAAAPLIKANFNPDEPRIPAGQPRGGEWTSGDGDAANGGDIGGTEGGSSYIFPVSDQTCAEFIAENCQARILRIFPGQFLDSTVDDVLNAARQGDRAAQRAKKLLFENRFRK